MSRECFWHKMKSHFVVFIATCYKKRKKKREKRRKEGREREIFSAIVNDSPGILYYDNKRRRPLRKADSHRCVHATRTFSALFRVPSLFIFIFFILGG